jgi:hypothetical protein
MTIESPILISACMTPPTGPRMISPAPAPKARSWNSIAVSVLAKQRPGATVAQPAEIGEALLFGTRCSDPLGSASLQQKP